MNDIKSNDSTEKKWELESKRLLLKTTHMANKFTGFFTGYGSVVLGFGTLALGAGTAHQEVFNPSGNLMPLLAGVGVMATATAASFLTHELQLKLARYTRIKIKDIDSKLNDLSEHGKTQNTESRASKRAEMRLLYGDSISTAQEMADNKIKMKAALPSLMLNSQSMSQSDKVKNNDHLKRLKEKSDKKNKKENNFNSLGFGS
jgi:hypothetical protein